MFANFMCDDVANIVITQSTLNDRRRWGIVTGPIYEHLTVCKTNLKYLALMRSVSLKSIFPEFKTFSPHLDRLEVVLPQYVNSRWDYKIDLSRTPRLTVLELLSAYQHTFDFSHTPNLKTLKIKNCSGSIDLSPLVNLESLSINVTRGNIVGMELLVNLKHLTITNCPHKLNVENLQLTTIRIDLVAYNSRSTFIDFDKLQPTLSEIYMDTDFDIDFTRFPNLTTIALGHRFRGNVDVSHCSLLKILITQHSGQVNLHELSKLQHLEHLVYNDEPYDENQVHFSRKAYSINIGYSQSTIKEFTLSTDKLYDKPLHISNYPNLRKLTIIGECEGVILSRMNLDMLDISCTYTYEYIDLRGISVKIIKMYNGEYIKDDDNDGDEIFRGILYMDSPRDLQFELIDNYDNTKTFCLTADMSVDEYLERFVDGFGKYGPACNLQIGDQTSE